MVALTGDGAAASRVPAAAGTGGAGGCGGGGGASRGRTPPPLRRHPSLSFHNPHLKRAARGVVPVAVMRLRPWGRQATPDLCSRSARCWLWQGGSRLWVVGVVGLCRARWGGCARPQGRLPRVPPPIISVVATPDPDTSACGRGGSGRRTRPSRRRRAGLRPVFADFDAAPGAVPIQCFLRGRACMLLAPHGSCSGRALPSPRRLSPTPVGRDVVPLPVLGT